MKKKTVSKQARDLKSKKVVAPTDLRTVKGDATKARLLEESIILFAECGYSGVSTRTLANAAASNVALITFHFGGKQALYEAAFNEALDRLKAVMVPPYYHFKEALAKVLEQSVPASHAPATQQTRQVLLQGVLQDMLRTILAQSLPSGPTPGLFQLLFRELHTTGPLGQRAREELITPFIQLLDQLFAQMYPNALAENIRLAGILLLDSLALPYRDFGLFLSYLGKKAFDAEDASCISALLCSRINMDVMTK